MKEEIRSFAQFPAASSEKPITSSPRRDENGVGGDFAASGTRATPVTPVDDLVVEVSSGSDENNNDAAVTSAPIPYRTLDATHFESSTKGHAKLDPVARIRYAVHTNKLSPCATQLEYPVFRVTPACLFTLLDPREVSAADIARIKAGVPRFVPGWWTDSVSQNVKVSKLCRQDDNEDWLGCDHCGQYFYATCASFDFATALFSQFYCP
ncbi:predicted protein [Nematostella vectensis]|uniref:Uncharacterized protein n=1 Tax=Nematostella vectensis TaxID=45351 RepID=A7SYH0_NEMVE|nr:predicted protein [Nematostella vectensis]|eukprot:XP_001623339.1 predicted protein [Nematostella vectensis]